MCLGKSLSSKWCNAPAVCNECDSRCPIRPGSKHMNVRFRLHISRYSSWHEGQERVECCRPASPLQRSDYLPDMRRNASNVLFGVLSRPAEAPGAGRECSNSGHPDPQGATFDQCRFLQILHRAMLTLRTPAWLCDPRPVPAVACKKLRGIG